MKYTASCHCQAIRLEADINIESVLSCNCSICQRRGHLLAFADAGQVKFLGDQKTLGDYQYGKKKLHFHFCKNCGTAPYGKGISPEGKSIMALNVRCFEDVDLKNFKVTEFDGKHQL
jgi:hypothetical protein